MTHVRAHIKGHELSAMQKRAHDELALEPILRDLSRDIQAAMDDDAMRELTLKEWPELAFFPADGGMI